MRLAEALILRADLQKKMEQIKNRLYNNVLTQEGESPSEDPEVLLQEYMSLQKDLTHIIKAINRTNNNTPFNDNISLSEALVERDAIISKRTILSNAADRASEKQDRYSKSEIKNVSTIDIRKFQKEADILSKDFRELDTKIQALNWNIDLI